MNLIRSKISQNWNLNEIPIISGNIDRTKKADHILEIPALGEFCGYFFKNQVEVGWRLNATNKFQDQKRLLICLATVIFPY